MLQKNQMNHLEVGTHDTLVEKLKESQELGLFLINVDNFSNINNAYGYEIGTKVLQELT